MADLPILFSASMVRAILREIDQPGIGKTQTRRVLDMPPMTFDAVFNDDGVWHVGDAATGHRYAKLNVRYRVGDRLYVREAWHAARSLDSTPPRDIPRDADIEHAATARSYAEIGLKGKLRPAMFLPRWASRITLIVTDVRVQRLQEISGSDAQAEGMPEPYLGDADPPFEEQSEMISRRKQFRNLWNSLNAERGYGWDANPWVAAYTFQPMLGNIDQVQP